MSKKKKRVLTPEERRAEETLMVMENDNRTATFFDTVDPEQLRQLTASILQLSREGIDDDKIARILSITKQEVIAIKRSPEFLESVHNLIDDPADLVRTMIQAKVSSLTHVLIEKALAGDNKAMAMCMKAIGADKGKAEGKNREMERFIMLLREFGMKDKSQIATERIVADKKARMLEEDPDIIDSTAEVIEPEKETTNALYEELKADSENDPETDPQTDSEDEE